MKLYSTKNKASLVSLSKAVLKGLPDDNGLFMPEYIPTLPPEFIENIKDYSFQEIAYIVCSTMFQGAIPEEDLKEIVYEAINFPAPLVKLDEQKYILELFHGPSLAFKDFGARFMARLMSYFDRGNDDELVILVATSGDTGGAVAAGFYKTPGIKVVILYPSGKVSHLQEQQLTTLGHNITALEVDGTFDDCQALVKQAFLDKELTSKIRLTSANSINIARLIPQSFYYFEAYKQLDNPKNVVFCIPSGNFGNLTAGLFAAKMGLPVHKFIAATNANSVVPEYLENGTYEPRSSTRTISNAMDVGNPSNFVRMEDLFGFTWNNMKEDIIGFSYTDKETEDGMKQVKKDYDYVIDPHGAVGYNALDEYQKINPNTQGIILETAHPSKFLPDVERVLGEAPFVPERLAELAGRRKVSVHTKNDFNDFKAYLLDNYIE
jgi:threonine synthase